MSQSAKEKSPQANSARRNWAEPAGKSALLHATAALARAGFADATIVLRWTAIVGPDVARVAEPVKLQEGADGATLTLRCELGATVFLQHDTRKIVDRINSYLGAGRVTRLRLVPGRLTRAAPSPPRRRAAPQSQDETVKPTLAEALIRSGQLRRNNGKSFRPD